MRASFGMSLRSVNASSKLSHRPTHRFRGDRQRQAHRVRNTPSWKLAHVLLELFEMADDKRALPQFRILKTGEQPPHGEYHILLVHRIRRLKLVHEITGHVPAPTAAEAAATAPFRVGANACAGTPGEALREAERMAAEYGMPVVYVRDDTPVE